MGYTHYFTTPEIEESLWSTLAEDLRDLFEVAAALEYSLGFESDSDEPTFVGEKLVRFNGKGEEGYETFILRREGTSSFVKTNRRKYDDVVTAALLILKYHVPNARISTDGNQADWEPGLRLANGIIGASAEDALAAIG